MFAELQAKLAGPSAKAMLRATAGEPLRKRAATTAAVAAPGSPGNQSVMSALKKTLLGRRQKVAASPSPRPTKLVPRSTRRKPNAENVAPDVATKIPQIKGLAVHLAHMDAKREQPNTGLHNDDEWAWIGKQTVIGKHASVCLMKECKVFAIMNMDVVQLYLHFFDFCSASSCLNTAQLWVFF
jgi:hypothetical protein